MFGFNVTRWFKVDLSSSCCESWFLNVGFSDLRLLAMAFNGARLDAMARG